MINDGVLGTRTRGSRMEGADESTELWRHPLHFVSVMLALGTSARQAFHINQSINKQVFVVSVKLFAV